MHKAVIFDRDGTIIIDKIYLNDPNLVEYMPGAFEALRKLRDLGFVFSIATNQSGLAKNIVTLKNMDLIHERISNDFARHGVFFKGFYYSPFPTTSTHIRRKPNPGMILDAAHDHGFDLKNSWMVGDRMIDVEAGHRAGCRSIMLEGVETPSNSQFAPPEAFVPGLKEAADFIEAFEKKKGSF